ncbi:MAG: VOC family protein [Selenomonadaceae bacterium]|nr:VOC family protein [Selenomonadaceae bacterium]MBR3721879.1 VOC family protein [Selenomonadaceae bacterium]
MKKKSSYLEHAAVTVHDIEWSIRFFENVLGMDVIRRKEANGKLEQVWLRGGLQLVSSPDNYAAGQGHHLGIVTEDFKGTLREMLAYEGVHAVDGKPEKWVELPDGLLLELFQEKPGAIDKVLSIEVK